MEIAHARPMEVKNAANSTAKRKKIASGEIIQPNSSNLENVNQCSCLIDSPENSTSSEATSVSSDQTPANLCSSNEFCSNSSRSGDLQVKNSKTDNSTFINREATPSEFADVMETSTKKTTNKAASAQKPSMAEIEEFFSVAEKYEAKRFAEKYNYDIVKDVPLEGKYQWVRINQ